MNQNNLVTKIAKAPMFYYHTPRMKQRLPLWLPLNPEIWEPILARWRKLGYKVRKTTTYSHDVGVRIITQVTLRDSQTNSVHTYEPMLSQVSVTYGTINDYRKVLKRAIND